MNIDYYAFGDPSDPVTWSGTTLELTDALKSLGVLREAYNIKPWRLTSIKQQDSTIDKARYIVKSLKYFTYYKGKIYLSSEYHPDILEKSREKALQIYRTHTYPDVIISEGEFAIFESTPFFIYLDSDMKTLIDWRLNGRENYFCDNMPMTILRERMDRQREAYDKARGLLITSKWVGKSLKSYINNPKKIYVVGMGHNNKPIKLSEQMIEERFESPRLLFVGKDGIRKGIDIVLLAFNIVRQELPEAKLKIITEVRDLPQKVKLDLNASSQNIESISTGISQDSLSEIYLRSSLFVLPSRFEPWGKVFFEAMAFGLPVIGAKNCAMPEFIKDDYNGYTTDYDAEKIADRIISIFNSFEKYKKLSENALKVSERNTWEKIARNIIKIINRNI